MHDTSSHDLLLRGVRLVPVGGPAPAGPVDVRLRGGRVSALAPRLAPGAAEVLDADGRWLAPGLWDAHVHLAQWSAHRGRLDLAGAGGPDEVLARVAGRLAAGRPAGVLVGAGYRSATWSQAPTVAALDAVAGDVPVVLVGGDGHSGWLSSAALRQLGIGPRTVPLEEAEWFAVWGRLGSLPGAPDPAQALGEAMADAAARGVVGVCDMEMEDGHAAWPARVAAGADLLRVRTATYAEHLAAVLAAGHRTGEVVEGARGLVTTGPLKVIFDGSLNTRTAWCCAPYAGARGDWRGVLNLSPEQLTALCRRAAQGGLEVAVHAIGDAAVSAALDAVEAAGARGSLEHVQLLAPSDLPRFAALGVRASVQPAHLLDDRDVTAAVWPDRQDRSFALRSLLDAGADVRLGSDAPVAPLDPWLAMAAAVHRSADDRPAWVPQEALTAAEALAASTDGRRTVAAGSPADLVLLDHDPLAPAEDARQAAAQLRAVRVAATLVGGRVTHRGL